MNKKLTQRHLVIGVCASVVYVLAFVVIVLVIKGKPLSADAVITFPANSASVAGQSTIMGTRADGKPIQLFLNGSTTPFYRYSGSGTTFTTVLPPTSCGAQTVTAQEYTDDTYATTSGSASTISVTVSAPCGSSLQIGDFVWNDNNNNGLRDDGVAGINGVYLELYQDTNANGSYDAGTDTFITGTLSISSGGFPGFYYFRNLPNGSYFVRIPSMNFATNGALHGKLSSTGTNNAYEPGALADSNVNNDDNGTQVGGSSGYAISSVITLAAGTEPTNDGDSSSNTNWSIDFGFVTTLTLGDYIWTDSNNNGLQDDGVSGINGVLVKLYQDTNGNGSYDAGTDTLVSSTTTYSNGGFPGHYAFADLYPGDYIVLIDSSNFTSNGALHGKASSTGANTYNTGTYEPAPDPDNNTSNDDNGTQIGGIYGYVVSNAITLTIGGEPSPGFGITNYNATLDFGFIPLLTLGNFVWSDTNNNGIYDEGIAGINNVTLNLFEDINHNNTYDNGVDVFIATTTTYSNGGFPGAYSFTNLYPGDYIVQIPNSNFTGSGALVGRSSSTGASNAYEPASDPDNDVNNDDNGYVASNPNYGVVSDAISLSVGGEPTPGYGITNYNATLDFGFYRPLDPTPDLLMTVGSDGAVEKGKQTVLSYIVANGYNGASASNPISFTASLPSGLSYGSQNVSGIGWTCTKSSTTLNCTYTGTYPVTTGKVLPEVFAWVDVSSSAASSLNATASVTTAGESSSVLSNNSYSKTLTIRDAGYQSSYQIPYFSALPVKDANYDSLLTLNGPGWTGSDAVFSQKLPDNRVVWIMADSYIGTSDPVTRERSSDTTMVHNSLIVQNGNTMTTLTNSGPSAYFDTGNASTWYWPTDALIENGKLLVFVREFAETGDPVFNFAFTGNNAIAVINYNTMTVEQYIPTHSNDGIAWGLAVYEGDNDYNYVYGNEDVSGARYAHIARVPKGSMTDMNAWEFYDGSGWSPNQSASARTISAAPAGVAKVNNGYVLVSIDVFTREVDGYFSATPYGPWSDPIALYTIPELQTGNKKYAYNPVIHTESTDSSGFLLSYAVNTLGGSSNSDDYRPWFIRLKFTDPNSSGGSSSGGSSSSGSTTSSSSGSTTSGTSKKTTATVTVTTAESNATTTDSTPSANSTTPSGSTNKTTTAKQQFGTVSYGTLRRQIIVATSVIGFAGTSIGLLIARRLRHAHVAHHVVRQTQARIIPPTMPGPPLP